MDIREVKKRKRTSLVCEACRKKKIRCDKGQPCNQCIKSKRPENCVYDPEALDIFEKSDKVMPYMASAKNPLNFNQQTSNNPNNNIQNHHHQPSHNVHTSSNVESKSEIDFLKERLLMLENNLKFMSSNGQPPQPNQPPEVIPTNYGIHQPIQLFNQKDSNSNSNGYSNGNSNGYSNGNSNGYSNGNSNANNNGNHNNYNNGNRHGNTMDNATMSFIPQPSTSLPQNGLSTGLSTLTTPSQYSFSPYNQPRPQQPPLQANQPTYQTLPPLGKTNQFQVLQTTQDSNEPSHKGSRSSGTSEMPMTSSDTSTFTPSDKISPVTPGIFNMPPPNQPQLQQSRNQSSTGSLDPLSLNGFNPYGSPEDSMSFYEGYSSVHIKEDYRRVSFGPFSWSSIMLKDCGLKLLWDYTIQMKEGNAKTALIFTNDKDQELNDENTKVLTAATMTEKSINLDEKVFEKRLLQPEGIDDMMPYELVKEQVEKDLEKASNNQSTLPLGLTFVNPKLEGELRLIDKIQLYLPKQKVIWKLINIFFLDVYPFMPFLDEVSFRREIQRIIGIQQYNDEKLKGIKIEKRLDFAQIGILLIILRLSYLSLFTNRNDINEKRLKTEDPEMGAKAYKYLLSNPITMNIIDIAQDCLNQFNIFRQPSVPILQLAYYMKLYHTYAPEDGDGADGGDSTSMLAILIQMAKSLGFHRDPDTYNEGSNKRDPINSTIRKIWYYLVLTDFHTSYAFGMPMLIGRESYDTKLPMFKEGEESLIDTKLDKFIVQFMNSRSDIYEDFRVILDKILNVNEKFKLSEVCALLSNFENLITKKFGNLKKCITLIDDDYSDFARTFRTKFYLALKAFLIVIYFYFFEYYDSKNTELSFFYLKKLLMVSVGEVMPYYFTLLGNIKCDLFINPTFQQFIHKTNQVFIALIIRANFIIYNMKIKPEHERKCNSDTKYLRYYKTLCKTSSSLTRCLEVSIAVISKISNRYYYAWRITKGHTALLRLITKKEFYEVNYAKASKVGGLCTPIYTIDQLDEIINICEDTLNKLGKEDKAYVFSPELFDDKSQVGTPINDMKTPAMTPSMNFFKSPGPNIDPNEIPTTTNKHQDKNNHENNSYSNMNHLGSLSSSDMGADDFNLDFVENAEIDKLWIELLNSKNETKTEDQQNDNFNLNEFKTEDFDVLNNLPFDQLFK